MFSNDEDAAIHPVPLYRHRDGRQGRRRVRRGSTVDPGGRRDPGRRRDHATVPRLGPRPQECDQGGRGVAETKVPLNKLEQGKPQ